METENTKPPGSGSNEVSPADPITNQLGQDTQVSPEEALPDTNTPPNTEVSGSEAPEITQQEPVLPASAEEPRLSQMGTEDDASFVIEPSLDISREQTPDVDDDTASTYTDSVAASSDSENESSFRRKRTPSLAMDRAVIKKTRPGDTETPEATQTPEADPENSIAESSDKPLATKEKYRKRVTGKMIDKLWERLDGETFKSFESLCEMSMSKALERFESSSNKDAKLEEAQRLLTQHWLSDKMPKSFLARLRMTKLPPTKSIIVRTKGMKPGNFDPLNIDQVNHRKATFESYLSAEMKQLESLESYYNSLKNTYNVDQEYLNDFRRTTSSLMSQIASEREENSHQLHLDEEVGEPPRIKLAKKTPKVADSASTAMFDPNTDDDVVSLLEKIESNLEKAQYPKELLGFCDQLDIVQQQLHSYRRKNDREPLP